MDIKELFKPYKGNDGYIFISYNHADSDIVYDIISELHSRGYRIWHDNGIPGGSNFVDTLADKITDCKVFFSFLSSKYITSDYCKSELHYAFSERKPVIPIKLDPVELPPGIKFRFAAINYITMYKFDSVIEMVDAICDLDEEILAPCYDPSLDQRRAGVTDGERKADSGLKAEGSGENADDAGTKKDPVGTPPPPPPSVWKKYGLVIGIAVAAVVILGAVMVLRPGKEKPDASSQTSQQQEAVASTSSGEASSENNTAAVSSNEHPAAVSSDENAAAENSEGNTTAASFDENAADVSDGNASDASSDVNVTDTAEEIIVHVTAADPEKLISSGKKSVDYLKERLHGGIPLSVYDPRGNDEAEADLVYDNAMAALALLAESSNRNSSTTSAGKLLDPLVEMAKDSSGFRTRDIAALSIALLRADRFKPSITYARTAQSILDQVTENCKSEDGGFCSGIASEDRYTADNILLYSAFQMMFEKTKSPSYKDAMDAAEAFVKSMRSEDSSYFLTGVFKDTSMDSQVVSCEVQALAALVMNDQSGIEKVSGLRRENGCFSPDSDMSVGVMECTAMMACAYQKTGMEDLAAESISAVYAYQLDNGSIPEADIASIADAPGKTYTNVSRTSAAAWYAIAALRYDPFN